MSHVTQAPSSDPLLVRTVEESIFRLLRDEILTLELAPETPLGIAGIAERFGLSFTPVRGALRRLQAEGLVVSVPHRGSIVAPVTSDQADLVLTVTGALERRLTQLGLPQLSAEDLHYLRQAIDERRAARQAPDAADQMVATAERIRHLIFRHVQNALFQQQFAAWSQQRRRYLRYYRRLNPGPANFMTEKMTEYAERCLEQDVTGADAVLWALESGLRDRLTSQLAHGSRGGRQP